MNGRYLLDTNIIIAVFGGNEQVLKKVKEELAKIDQVGTDEAIEDALWQLKFGFNRHWGNHCINAMRALHYLWYDRKVAM